MPPPPRVPRWLAWLGLGSTRRVAVVIGWGQHIDDLAATASLLQIDLVGARAMTDTRGKLDPRDAVVAQLRELVGAVSEVPYLEPAPDRPMAGLDVTRLPGQALRRA